LAKKKDLKALPIKELKATIDSASRGDNTVRNVQSLPKENEAPKTEPIILNAYELILQQALENQLVCDSLQTEMNTQKNQLRETEELNQRQLISSSIKSNEFLLKEALEKTDSLFMQAHQLSDTSVVKDLYKQEDEVVALSKNVDGLRVFSYKNQQEDTLFANKNSGVQENILPVQKNKNTANAAFAILESSPYRSSEPIPAITILPKGLVYRIQLGAYSQELPMNYFGGLTPVSLEKLEDRSVVKYYVGQFYSSKESRIALEQVKDYGYKDAFIVPYKNNQKITIHEAREIEFGQKSLLE
jgi:hypothetical protein